MTSVENRRTVTGAQRRSVTVLVAVAVAVAANLVIYGIGRLAGGTFEFTVSGTTTVVSPLVVTGFSIVPLAIGLTIVALLAKPWRWVVPVALVVGPVLALITILIMTVPAGFDAPSFIALALCHAALVPIMIAAILALRRRVDSPVSASDGSRQNPR